VQNRVITLALDTALSACTVGIVQNGIVLAQAQELRARGHAERLVMMVQEVLEAATSPQIDRVITTLGPGSFTGLRVALSAAQAFGLAWACPVLGVSTLEAVAWPARNTVSRKILVAHDAGRGQTYAQLFDSDAVSMSAQRTGLAADMYAWAAEEHAILLGGGAPVTAPGYDIYPHPLAMSALIDAGRGTEKLAPLYGTTWAAPAA
jgi:tRNA threonylcarbamoyladenosine biosynthesis protein TsaB